MATYKTPDVYVEEISLFPPSVAEVETAIPAFIGYTEKASKDGQDLKNIPTKIDSFVEFEQLFGGPPPIQAGHFGWCRDLGAAARKVDALRPRSARRRRYGPAC